MAKKIYPTVLSGAFVLFVISVGVRSQSGDDKEISDYDRSTYTYTDRPTSRLTDPPNNAELISKRRQERIRAEIREHIRKVLNLHGLPDFDFSVELQPT